MILISLKDYAKNNNVSYEAVRQQVKRYSKELVGHIIKDNRTQFLDEEAAAFLDSKREKNPVVVINQDKDDTIKALEEENKALLQRIALLQDDLIKAKDLHMELQGKLAEQQLLAERATAAEERAITAEERALVAEEENKALSDIAEINAQESQKAKEEAAELRAELERLKSRGFWARVFNKERSKKNV